MIWPRVWGVLPVRETGAGSTAQRRRSREGCGVSHSHAQNIGPCVTVLGPQSSSPQQDIVLLGPETPNRETGEEQSTENRNQWTELALLPQQRNSTGRSILAFKRN